MLQANTRSRLGSRIAVALAWACLFSGNLAWGVPASPRTTISLDGDGWTLASCAFGEGERNGLQLQATSKVRSVAIAVPNDVQMSAFVKDPLGQSPNLVEVNNKEWWYTRQFPSPRVGPNRQVRLVFDGVDYFADVWLNGVKLGSHEGAYTRFEFDVTDRLSGNGSNYLAVRVTAPWKVAGRSHYEFMKGEFDEWWDALPGPGQVIFPLGLHRSVRLEVTSYSRISAVGVWTTGLKDSDAELASVVQLVNRGGATSGSIQLTITPETFSGGSVQLPVRGFSFQGTPDENAQVDFTIEIKDAKLWWTWDLGPQNLYRAEAQLLDSRGNVLDSTSTVFGIRTLERDPNLLYRINGRPLFMRGAWYPMSKLYPASTDRWTYEKDLRLARNANMNSLVNFTVVEKDDFYDLADRLGILLFVELPFNQEGPIDALNAAYMRRKEFIEWSSREVRQIIRQLRNHPAVGVWTPVSEVTENGHDFSVGWDPRVAQAADGYALFLRTMQDIVTAEAHGALYFPSFCDFGEHHFWEGSIFSGTTYDQQFDNKADFVSEYGALGSFPLEDIARVIDPGTLWNSSYESSAFVRLPVALQRFSYVHPWQYSGLDFSTAEISAYVTRRIVSFRDYVHASQIYQSFLYGYAGDAYRRKIFAPIHGIRSWMFKSFPEIPVGGFGVIDAYDNPTPAYYVQKRTYAPVTMSFAIRNMLESVPSGSDFNVPVWISNITDTPLTELELEYALYDLGGNVLHSDKVRVAVAANRAQEVAQFELHLPDQSGIYLLRGRARQGGKDLALASTYVKVAPSATRKPLRVLVAGTPDWAGPVSGYLLGLGAKVTTALTQNTVVRPIPFPASSALLEHDYDVIWLAGYDNYWREAPQQVTDTIMDAVRAGVTFIHTGSPASFHGGGEKSAALDLTPLAELLPVILQHENDIAPKSSFRMGSQANELASHEPLHLGATSSAPKWIQKIPFGNLAPGGFHMLQAKPGSQVLLEMDKRALLVRGRYGKGETFAYLGFSPEGSLNTDQAPLILDRAIQSSSEDRLFATMCATLLALASREDPPVNVADLIEGRAKPLFQTLLERPPTEAPRLAVSWTLDSEGRTIGHVRIENGPQFIFGLRLRLDGADIHDGRTLPVWSDQYFDLLPREVAEATVTLWQRTPEPAKPLRIIIDTVNGVEKQYPGPGSVGSDQARAEKDNPSKVAEGKDIPRRTETHGDEIETW